MRRTVSCLAVPLLLVSAAWAAEPTSPDLTTEQQYVDRLLAMRPFLHIFLE